MKSWRRFRGILFFVLFLPIFVNAKAGFELEINDNNLIITTSNSLNYGLLKEDVFSKNNYFESFEKTIMLNRTETFTQEDAKTEIALSDLNYDETTVQENILYSGFYPHLPGLMNYGTIFSIVLETLTIKSTGKVFSKNFAKKAKDFANNSNEILRNMAKWVNVIQKKVDVLLFISEQGEWEEGKDLLHTLNDSLIKLTKLLQEPISLLPKVTFQGENTALPAMWARVFKSESKISQLGTELEKNDYPKSIAFEIILTQLLKNFTNDNKFYYPKEIETTSDMGILRDVLMQDYSKIWHSDKYTSISTVNLARQFTRVLLDYPNISDKNKKIVKYTSKVMISSFSQKIYSWIKDDLVTLNNQSKMLNLINKIEDMDPSLD